MLWKFPPGREEKRQVLLDAVAEVREVLEAGADQSEEEGTLPQDSVDALYQSGLLALKLPAELGGAEADPVTQLEVIEGLARIDSSAAWCTVIGATSVGSWGAFCPTRLLNVCSREAARPRERESSCPLESPCRKAVGMSSMADGPLPAGFAIRSGCPVGSESPATEWRPENVCG